MPFALVFIGLVLVVTGAKGTMRELGAELREDFIGPGNFTWWIASLGAIGALGYIPELRSFSRWFMALIIISMIISNRGFFAKFTEALQSGPESPQPVSNPSIVKAAHDANTGGNIFGDMLKGLTKLAPLVPLL